MSTNCERAFFHVLDVIDEQGVEGNVKEQGQIEIANAMKAAYAVASSSDSVKAVLLEQLADYPASAATVGHRYRATIETSDFLNDLYERKCAPTGTVDDDWLETLLYNLFPDEMINDHEFKYSWFRVVVHAILGTRSDAYYKAIRKVLPQLEIYPSHLHGNMHPQTISIEPRFIEWHVGVHTDNWEYKPEEIEALQEYAFLCRDSIAERDPSFAPALGLLDKSSIDSCARYMAEGKSFTQARRLVVEWEKEMRINVGEIMHLL